MTYFVDYNEEKYSLKYLYYLLKTLNLPRLAKGVKPGINRNEVYDLIVPVPPLDEQKRIVAILDQAFASIAIAKANTEKNLANADELLESELYRLFDSVQDSETLTLGAMLERGWIESHLDGNHGSEYPRKEEFISSGVPYISANCLNGDVVNFDSAKYLSTERASRIHKGVAKNRDVLFAHNATVGPVAILKTDYPHVILGTSLTYYRCNPQYIASEYLALYMRSITFTRQYQLVMRQSTRNQVPITKQREFYHVIPSINQQEQIIQRFNAIQPGILTYKDSAKRKLAALDELKQSLLRAAFTGQLTAAEPVAA